MLKNKTNWYRVYFYNFDYWADERPETLEDAMRLCKKHCFQANIIDPAGELVVSFCSIGGFKHHKNSPEILDTLRKGV